MSKILILANSSGGLYDFRNGLVLGLLAEGHEVLASLPDEVRTRELSEEGCRVIYTPIDRRGMNPAHDLALIKQYRQILKKEKPDLVVTYTIKPNIYGGMLCRLMRIPYITTITGLGSAFEREGFAKKLIVFLYRMGIKGCRCVFFQNEENRQIFRNLKIQGKSDALVNGSGVDLDRHHQEAYPGHGADGITRFLYVGRMMREKGTDEYLETAEAAHAQYGDKVSFSAIGYFDDDYETKVRAAERAGILKMLPFDSNIHPYLAGADAVVMPSYHEGMSNVLMEASATGRPVLASDISGCREIVEDGVTGFLFPSRSAEGLKSAVDRFMKLDDAQRQEMGRNARLKMEREFDRQCIINAYMNAIREILHS